MARKLRKLADDGVYHVLNRGNGRMRIFYKRGDFEAFLKLLEEGRKRTGMRILGYCLMDNHWHLVLWPRKAADLSRFVAWVCTTHVRRWREHRQNRDGGHLYQGRFKDFLVQEDGHFLTLMRYVESNPLRAKMVRHAQDWPWSSLGSVAGSGDARLELEPWPVDKPRDWLELVNEKLEEQTLDTLRLSVKRGRPFGTEKWVTRMVNRYALEGTVRNPWRPSKKNGKAGSDERAQNK